jgi:hypothetical protein
VQRGELFLNYSTLCVTQLKIGSQLVLQIIDEQKNKIKNKITLNYLLKLNLLLIQLKCPIKRLLLSIKSDKSVVHM